MMYHNVTFIEEIGWVSLILRNLSEYRGGNYSGWQDDGKDPNYVEEWTSDGPGNNVDNKKKGMEQNGIAKNGQGEFALLNFYAPSSCVVEFSFVHVYWDFVTEECYYNEETDEFDECYDLPEDEWGMREVVESVIINKPFAVTFYDFDNLQNDFRYTEAVSCNKFNYADVTNTTTMLFDVDPELRPDGTKVKIWNETDTPEGLIRLSLEPTQCVDGICEKTGEACTNPICGDGNGFLQAMANVRGTGQDNPDQAENLNQEQSDKSITFHYNNVENFAVNFQVLQAANWSQDGQGGRNYLFAFKEPFAVECEWGADYNNDPFSDLSESPTERRRRLNRAHVELGKAFPHMTFKPKDRSKDSPDRP